MAAFFLVTRDWHMAVIAVVKVGKPAVMSAITIESAISYQIYASSSLSMTTIHLYDLPVRSP